MIKDDGRARPSPRQRLVDQLIAHEGRRRRGDRHIPYRDPAGVLTIGYGRNLTANGLSEGEALLLLDHDIDEAVTDLARFPWYVGLDDVRQRAITDLRFTLGPGRFRGFHRLLAAMTTGDHASAAAHLRSSRWFRQVGRRGFTLVHMLATGEDP